MRILVTGASGALGLAVVRALRARGDSIASLVFERSSDVQDKPFEIVVPDLSLSATAAQSVQEAVSHLGGLDAVICLAGAFRFLRVEETSFKDWEGLFSDNLGSALNVILASLPHLHSGSSVVCVGASAAAKADSGMAPYAAAKSAIARLVEALGTELRQRNIRVNAVAPTIIDTPRNRTDMPDADFADWTRPEAIADLILFLTSEGSRAVSGAVIAAGHSGS